jgi:hypothetical protein
LFIASYLGSQTFTGKLEFVVKDCDPETGEADEEGYEDSYMVSFNDYSAPFDLYFLVLYNLLSIGTIGAHCWFHLFDSYVAYAN